MWKIASNKSISAWLTHTLHSKYSKRQKDQLAKIMDNFKHLNYFKNWKHDQKKETSPQNWKSVRFEHECWQAILTGQSRHGDFPLCPHPIWTMKKHVACAKHVQSGIEWRRSRLTECKFRLQDSISWSFSAARRGRSEIKARRTVSPLRFDLFPLGSLLDHCWTAFESIGVETWKLDEAWPGRTFAVRLDRAYRAEFQKSKSWSWAWTEEKSMAVANCVFPRLRCEGRPRMAQIAHGRLMWMSHMSHCDNSSNPCPAVSVTGEGQWMAAWGTASQRNAGGLRRGTGLIWCNGENPGRKRQGERRWEKEKGERRSQALKIPLTRRERCVQRCRKDEMQSVKTSCVEESEKKASATWVSHALEEEGLHEWPFSIMKGFFAFRGAIPLKVAVSTRILFMHPAPAVPSFWWSPPTSSSLSWSSSQSSSLNNIFSLGTFFSIIFISMFFFISLFICILIFFLITTTTIIIIITTMIRISACVFSLGLIHINYTLNVALVFKKYVIAWHSPFRHLLSKHFTTT